MERRSTRNSQSFLHHITPIRHIISRPGLFICYLLFAFLHHTNAQVTKNFNLEHWFDQLDEAIKASPNYVNVKENQLELLRRDIYQAHTPKQKYEAYMQLFVANKAYKNDSAIKALQDARAVAMRMKRTDLVYNCDALIAFQYSTTGCYHEAFVLLQQIDSTKLTRQQMVNYYKAYAHVYGELAYYSTLEPFRHQWFKESGRYEELLLRLLKKDSPDYLMLMSKRLYTQKKYAEALRLNTQWLNLTNPASRDFAIVAYYRYLIYNIQNQSNMSQYWLARSAISDIKHAVMDQGSLWSLADILRNRGDELDRAYQYISFSWNCANTFGTRVRSYQISPILSAIEKNYQTRLATTNRQLKWLLGATGLMALLLLFLLYDANKHRKRLADARNHLKQTNAQLASLNVELQTANEQLDHQNRQLQQNNETILSKNEQLYEANQVKEEYIGRFLSLCSLYIDKMENLRKRTHKLVKAKLWDELYRQTDSTEMKEREINELYAHFDEAFLHLFPNFVDDFNSLLKPEERIAPPNNQELNTTLRIFALIRLGIDDSSKIAEFLHYSVNTIYNYRARIKNGALVERNDFEKLVKQLGSINEIQRRDTGSTSQ